MLCIRQNLVPVNFGTALLPIIFDSSYFHVERNEFVEYLKAEGALGFAAGYVNCHRLPALVKRIAYGNSGFPWNLNPKVKYHYGRGVCPNAEEGH